MSIPIELNLSGRKLPELEPGEMRYVIARDGVYLDRRGAFYSTSVLLKDPPAALADYPQRCVIDCAPIPTSMLAEMIGFFQAAYELHGGEAALVLLYYPDDSRFEWHCPSQTVEVHERWGKWYVSDSVEFENPLSLPLGAMAIGDAHSHEGSPHPSWVDKHDEDHLDGLHLIVGNIVRTQPTLHTDFAIDGARFRVPDRLIIEDWPEPPYPSPPAEWMDRIRIVKFPSTKENTSRNPGGGTRGNRDYDSGSDPYRMYW